MSSVADRYKKSYDKSVYQSLTMITQFSIHMLVPICLMSALGIYLDQKMGTSFWMIVLFFVGALAGGQNVYRLARKIYAPKEADKSGNTPEINNTGTEVSKQRMNRT